MVKNKVLHFFDILIIPFVYPASFLLKFIRKVGVHRLPACRNVFLKVGVFPIRNHYYEPQFDNRNPSQDFLKDRNLPGIDWNIEGQIEMLSLFNKSEELVNIPYEKPITNTFYLNNRGFQSGDAECWYQIIRAIKPKRIFEIGSGNSTLMAINAIEMNKNEDPNYTCEHVCIEPYHTRLLDALDIKVIRKKVEDVELSFFLQLHENDILFIDSSHIIRPQGDVLFEYLELLPTLNKGVIVHIHDIFSPKNYRKYWLQDKIRFWNEQYLLEAFLTNNRDWKIICAVNLLYHKHYKLLKQIAPFLSTDREPGSFYIQKTH